MAPDRFKDFWRDRRWRSLQKPKQTCSPLLRMT
jgi:hypothetical protein